MIFFYNLSDPPYLFLTWAALSFLMCDKGVLFAGEGYEYTVTVDDEDSKVIIFDNWKQVSDW